MLIVANGAMKSGSTWLYYILENIVPGTNKIPIKYQNVGPWKEPSIHPDQLDNLLCELDFHSTNYVVKNHYSSVDLRNTLLSKSEVYVFNIARNYRDVIVSNYYHIKLRDGYDESFAKYYWTIGREMIDKLKHYHKLWDPMFPRVYCSSYENLKSDFESEVQNIAEFIGVKLTVAQIARIEEATTICKLRRKYNEESNDKKFFRKGVVGDWKNHMNWIMRRDSGKISEYGIHKLPRFDKYLAYANKYLITLRIRLRNKRKRMLDL